MSPQVHKHWMRLLQMHGHAPNVITKKSTYQLPLGHQATLQIGSTWVTSHFPTAIKEAEYRPAMVEYIMARAWWEVKDVCNMVDWEVQP